MINVNVKEILNAVKKANKIKNTSTLDICDCIELSVEKYQLKIYRFCMDIQYTELINIEWNNLDFETICINSNELQKILMKCKDDVVLSSADKSLLIKGKYDFSLMGFNDDSMRYVDTISFESFSSFTQLDAEPLEYLKKAMSKDQTRFVLNGIYFDEDKGNIVATDGRRLHKYSTKVVGTGIVPGVLFNLIKGNCKVRFDKEKVFILNEGGIYSSTAIEGIYSNYEQIIPPSFKHKLSIDMAFVKDSLSMIKSNEACSLNITANKHSVTNSIAMSVDHANPDLKDDTICFNRQYLVDAINDTDIALDFNDEYKPVRYKNGDYMAVIMPMRK